MLSPGGSLTSKQLQRMVTALDLASDKGAEISALEADLVQAKSKALLYEVQRPSHALQALHVDCQLFSILKRLKLSGNLNSETFENNKSAFLHWNDL